MFVIPGWRLKRAIRQVVQIFRKTNATSVKNAKTVDALGLRPLGFFERMLKLRDYKPYALTVMMSAGVVLQTEDGKVYLSEEKLGASTLSKYAPPLY